MTQEPQPSAVDVATRLGFTIDDLAVEITPRDAENLLNDNLAANRNRRRDGVAALADDMRNGRFVTTAATIVVSDTGHLIDGQHRLAACVESQVPFRAIVVRDVPESAYQSIDRGKKRTLSDTLRFFGETDTNHFATLVGRAAAWDSGTRTSMLTAAAKRTSEARLVAYYQDNRDELRATMASTPHLPRHVGPTRGNVLIVSHLTRRVDPEQSAAFLNALAGKHPGEHPALDSLREQMTRHRDAMAKHTGVGDAGYWYIGTMLHAWNKWRVGDPTKVLFSPSGTKRNRLPDGLL